MDSEKLLHEIRLEMVQDTTVTSNFMISPSLKRRFKSTCARNAQSMSSVLETLMTSYIVQDNEMRENLAEQGDASLSD